jgi:hypothetical protein
MAQARIDPWYLQCMHVSYRDNSKEDNNISVLVWIEGCKSMQTTCTRSDRAELIDILLYRRSVQVYVDSEHIVEMSKSMSNQYGMHWIQLHRIFSGERWRQAMPYAVSCHRTHVSSCFKPDQVPKRINLLWPKCYFA